MTHRVHISEKALADVESVLAWFQGQSVTAAGERWFATLWKALSTLEVRPERCSLLAEAEEIGRDVRELLFGRRHNKYRILFEVRGRLVFILRIWHSARNAITAADL